MKLITTTDLDALAARARAAPRGRAHLTVHASDDDAVQRFFVCADARSYFRPHCHLSKSELAVVLRGTVDLLVFDDAGVVLARHDGQVAGNAYETPEGTWHTLVVREDGSCFFEVKQGPYNPATAVSYAVWAPPEGDAAVPAFQAWLQRARPGMRWQPSGDSAAVG
ncbi:MAG: hypothetical protein RL026_2546 [Pseudomonadota bacterium]|jgi:cupin fold WbuC family metalloprotein